MDEETKQRLIEMIRRTTPSEIAAELVNVQPIDPSVMQQMFDNALSEEELRSRGYEPIEQNGLGLLWIRKRRESANDDGQE